MARWSEPMMGCWSVESADWLGMGRITGPRALSGRRMRRRRIIGWDCGRVGLLRHHFDADCCDVGAVFGEAFVSCIV